MASNNVNEKLATLKTSIEQLLQLHNNSYDTSSASCTNSISKLEQLHQLLDGQKGVEVASIGPLQLPSLDPDRLIRWLKELIARGGVALVKVALRMIAEALRFDTIDSTAQAALHYYIGGGSTVSLGPNTVNAIKNSPDVDHYRQRIEGGLTSGPAQGSGLSIDMTWRGVDYFHLGRMTLSYRTTCRGNTCTTTYTVDDDGFVDPNYLSSYIFGGDDSLGPNNELGGTPFDYRPVTWSETFTNPGYPVDANGRPGPIQR